MTEQQRKYLIAAALIVVLAIVVGIWLYADEMTVTAPVSTTTVPAQ